MLHKKTIYYTASICLLLGFTGILFSSHTSNYDYSEYIFILSSLLLGLCLLIFIIEPDLKNNNINKYIIIAIFSIAIIKVISLHIKYGMYLGADSVAEFSVIRYLFNHQFELTANSLNEFPLSYIYVYLTSSILNIDPLAGTWNAIHLITNALTVVFLYLLVNSIFDRNIAIISCIVYMYNPAVSIFSLSMTRENFGVLFLVMSVYIMQLQSKHNKPERVILYIILVACLILSHYTTAYFSLLTMALIFSIGYIQYLVTGKIHYRHFYALFFVILLFVWIYNITYHHQGDVRIGNSMLSGIKDIFIPDATTGNVTIASSRETFKILYDFSLIQILFKLQAALIALGSLFLIINIRKLSPSQYVFAILALLYTCLLAVSAVAPSLADSLSPTRIMRYGIIFSCISVGYLLSLSNHKLSPNKKRSYTVITIILVSVIFVYPITSWIATEYMAFTPEPYPSKLRSEMYNIRSIHEINVLTKINQRLPANSTLALEWQLQNARNFILQKSSVKSIQLNEDILFNTTNHPSNNFMLLRKSLYENKQYITYTKDWKSAPTFLCTINNSQWFKLDSKIKNMNLISNDGSYKLLKMK